MQIIKQKQNINPATVFWAKSMLTTTQGKYRSLKDMPTTMVNRHKIIYKKKVHCDSKQRICNYGIFKYIPLQLHGNFDIVIQITTIP